MLEHCNKQKLFLSQGIKSTKQRNLVYDILEKSELPISAEQIFQKLSEIDPSVNISTVYRTLEMFVNKGLALKSNIIGTNSAGYELNRMEHKHQLICLKCNKIISINDCPLKKLEESIKKETEFDIMGHKLELYGYCPTCKQSIK